MKFGKQKIKWIVPVPDNVEDLKSIYRKLALENHPDRGGDKIKMQEINAEYTALFEELKDVHKSSRPDGPKTYRAEQKTTETPEDFINIVNELFRLDGITCELAGRWIWISGDTRKHKDRLKELGCRWSKNKQMWHWNFPGDAAMRYKGKREWSMERIRSHFGSEVLRPAEENRRDGYVAIGA